MEALHALSEAWPIVTGLVLAIVTAAAWASKILFMLRAIEAKIDCMGQNIATHKHDPASGDVVIPAR